MLNIASFSKVKNADYFLAMQDACAEGGENIYGAIFNFDRFFRAQKLHVLRLHMVC